MASDKYILEGKTPKQIDDLYAWGKWMETGDRRVAKTNANGYVISTVFLGLDHNFANWSAPGKDIAKPILFETMVFDEREVTGWGGSHPSVDEERWSTWEEAEVGHAAIVKRWKGWHGRWYRIKWKLRQVRNQWRDRIPMKMTLRKSWRWYAKSIDLTYVMIVYIATFVLLFNRGLIDNFWFRIFFLLGIGRMWSNAIDNLWLAESQRARWKRQVDSDVKEAQNQFLRDTIDKYILVPKEDIIVRTKEKPSAN